MAAHRLPLCPPTLDEPRKKSSKTFIRTKGDRLGFQRAYPLYDPPSSVKVEFPQSVGSVRASRVHKAPGCRRTVCQPVSRKSPKFIFRNLAMDLNVKLLPSPGGRNDLIIIAGGLIDAEGLERIFRAVAETIRQLFSCKILIDFENANLRIEPADIDELVSRLGPDLRLGNIAIALVSSAETAEPEQLRVLRDSLCREDLRAAVFHKAQEAVLWLIDTI